MPKDSFVFVHGGGDSGWAWHLVEADLRERGFATAAPDLPDGDTSIATSAQAVVAAADRPDPILVAHSFGAFAATLAATELQPRLLVYVAAMVPRRGESPAEWWAAFDHEAETASAAEADGGLTGHEDPFVAFLHDLPRELAEEAMRRGRDADPADYGDPFPVDVPDVPTRFVLGGADRFFPARMMRRVARERLGVEPVEIRDAGHCLMLSRPAELARVLAGWSDQPG